MNAPYRQVLGLSLTAALGFASEGAEAGRLISVALGDTVKTNEASRVVVDAKGNVYVVGQAASALYGRIKVDDNAGAFVGKYTPQGKLLWGRQLSQPNLDLFVTAAAIDGKYLYAVGQRRGSGSLATTSIGFITKLNVETGIPLWSQLIEPAAATPDAAIQISDIRFDNHHIARIVGTTNAGLRFNGQTIPGGGCTDGFLLAMTRTGATKEVPIVVGGQGADDCVRFEGVRLDRNDGLYVTGTSSVSLFGQTVTGTSDLLIAKAETFPVTSWKWGRLFGQPGQRSQGEGLAIADLQAQGYVAGTVQGIEPGAGPQGTVIAFDPATGAARWTRYLESPDGYGSHLFDVDVDPIGAAIAVGDQVKNAALTLRGLAVRYAPTGDLQRTEHFGKDQDNTLARFSSVTQQGRLSYLSGFSSFGLFPDAPLSSNGGMQAIATTYTLGSTPTARDNNVTIGPNVKGVASDWGFTWSGQIAYTSGQPFNGVQAVPVINGGVEIDVNVGRQGSYPPVQWFMQQITAQPVTADGNSNTPSNLNFAITGTLTIGSASYPIALGQGRSYSNIVGNNNWWLGGTAPGFVYVQNFYFPPGCGAPGTPACQYQGEMALITPDSQYAITPQSQDSFVIYPAN